MAKIAAAQTRLFKNVFICKRCKTKIKADSRKILMGKVRCRRCGGKNFRTKRKK